MKDIKSIPAPKPYFGYVIYGPLTDRSGRRFVSLYNKKTKKQRTITVARLLASVALRKKIPRALDVDHVDGNHENDKLRNLQILPHEVNVAKGAAGRVRGMLAFCCPACKREVLKKQHISTYQEGQLKYCSRSCARSLQGQVAKLSPKEFKKLQQLNNVHVETVSTQQTSRLPAAIKIPTEITEDIRVVMRFIKRRRVLTPKKTCHCGNETKRNRKFCSAACVEAYGIKKDSKAPPTRVLRLLAKHLTNAQLSRAYKVSHTTIKRWLRVA